MSLGKRQNGSTPKPPEGWTRCCFFVERKNRFCRQEPTESGDNAQGGLNYCGNHAHLYQTQPNRKRVPCPIDPSHSVYEDMLSKHVDICPRVKRRKIQEKETYYRHGFNTGGHGELLSSNQTKTPATAAHAKELALRIMKTYQRIFQMEESNNVKDFTTEQIHNAIPMMDLSKPELEAGLPESVDHHHIKSGGERHLIQQASLIGHLRHIGVLPKLNQSLADNESLTILELGAGRGMLGLVAAGAAASSSTGLQVNLVLVERAGSRSKAETVIRGAKKNADYSGSSSYLKLDDMEWVRIQCDLSHVHMPTVLLDLKKQKFCVPCAPAISDDQEKEKSTSDVGGGKDAASKLIIVAKHLCGVGTDLALRSLEVVSSTVDACVMATCCHGVCNWEDYVGRDFLRREIQGDDSGSFCFGKEEFEMMRTWSSGTVASTSNNKSSDTLDGIGDESAPLEHSPAVLVDAKDPFGVSSVVSQLGLACGVQGLGRACQRLIDKGRCEYMRTELFGQKSDGAVVELSNYVPATVTPQNAVLVAYRK